MESPPHKRNVGRDEDRISTLPDHLLLEILERLDLREAVRAGALSTRWRHLPHRLSRLHLDVRRFRRNNTTLETMDAFTGALLSLLAGRECDCNNSRAIKTLDLRFLLSAPHLSSIGGAIENLVSLGKIKCLEFCIAPPANSTSPLLTEFGQQFMSFSRAYPVVFRQVTLLVLTRFAFGQSDVTDLISACDELKHLTLRNCTLVGQQPVLKIDTPCSGLQKLDFDHFRARIELISVPKLRRVLCLSWRSENPPVHFGHVPELRDVRLFSEAKAWQEPFPLSECLSRSATNLNLSRLLLDFGHRHQMIWIQPEHPKQLAGIFRNLADVSLSGIFPECDLSWTLFILEAAPALQKFTLSRIRHACAIAFEDDAEKTNVVWEPSKDLKHLNLKLLWMYGFEEEDKVTNYIRLVMGQAVGLKRIELHGEVPCKKCDAIDPRRSQVDEACRHRIKERLTRGSSSSVEIIMC